MPRSFKITLPPIPKYLKPRSRPRKRMAYHRVFTDYKERAYYAALNAQYGADGDGFRALLKKATAHVQVFYRDRRGVMDPDNIVASLKAAFDGMQQAHLIVNDKHLRPVTMEPAFDKAHPRVEITVTPED